MGRIKPMTVTLSVKPSQHGRLVNIVCRFTEPWHSVVDPVILGFLPDEKWQLIVRFMSGDMSLDKPLMGIKY
jgi:hypothetical protein